MVAKKHFIYVFFFKLLAVDNVLHFYFSPVIIYIQHSTLLFDSFVSESESSGSESKSESIPFESESESESENFGLESDSTTLLDSSTTSLLITLTYIPNLIIKLTYIRS